MSIISTFMSDLIFLLENEPPLNLTYGTNLFKGPKARIPDGNGPFVSVIRSVGRGTEGTHNSTTVPAYERPGAQIVCRATDYDVAEAKILAIYAFMFPIRDRLINATYWRELNILGEPFDLTPDEKQRVRIAFNLNCVKRVSPATS